MNTNPMEGIERFEALELAAIRRLRRTVGNDFSDEDLEAMMDEIEAEWER